MTVAEVHADIRETLGVVPEFFAEVPDSLIETEWGSFKALVLSETAIPNKYKELIGLAVSGATRCKYCALFHTEAARVFGATDAEIAEASLMGGMTMCASTFLNGQQTDYETFAKETREIIEYVRAHQQPRERPTDGKTAHA